LDREREAVPYSVQGLQAPEAIPAPDTYRTSCVSCSPPERGRVGRPQSYLPVGRMSWGRLRGGSQTRTLDSNAVPQPTPNTPSHGGTGGPLYVRRILATRGGVLRRSQCDSLVRCNIATPTMMSPSAISFVIVSDSWKNHIPIIATSAVPIPDHTA
jgi:hypothetical protein